MAKRPQRAVPSFALYGEQAREEPPRRLHIEDIRSRSQRYAWEIAAHTHRGLHQCLVLLAGAAAVRVDERSSELAAPAVVLLPPGTVHAFRFREHTHGYVLTFAADTLLAGEAAGQLATLLALFEQPRLLALEPDDACVARVGGLLERLHAEFRQPEGAQAPVCGWLACSVLWILGRELARRRAVAPETRRQHRWFGEFRALLEAHYLEHWPVARYARALGLTEGRLNRLCEKQSGRSAFALAQERLALEARRRLIYIALPVAELARELGFRDPAYFSRFFRRHAGVPPDRFRRQHGAG